MTNQTSNPAGDSPGGGDAKPVSDDARALLTREKIEALLGASRGGPQATGIDALLDAEPAPFERLKLLEPVVERFAETLPRTLGSFAGGAIQPKLEAASSVKLGEYLDNLHLPAMLAVWRAEAWNGSGLVAVDGTLAAALLDALMGGKRAAAAQRVERRPYTPIERAVVERVIAAVLNDLSAAFRPICAVEFRLERLESDPRLAAIAPPSAVAAVIRFAVTVHERAGRLEIALPYSTLEPAAELLNRDHVGQKRRDRAWQGALAGEMGAAELRIEAVLDRLSVKLREVLGWKIGSRVMLNAMPGSPVELSSGGVKLFQGKLGRRDDRLAVRVERRMWKRHEH